MTAAHVGSWPVIVPARLHRGEVQINTPHLRRLLRGRHDCELSIIIERQHATRSIAQNRLYFGVYCAVLSEHTGYSKEEIHEILKAKFLPKKLALADANGEIVEEFIVGHTTTRLNKIQFGEYLEKIQHWAAEELGVVIPDPPRDVLKDERRRSA